MKMPTTTWLLAALMAPGLALAEVPAPPAQSLAIVDALVAHCTRLVPSAADRYGELARLMAPGVGEEALGKVRKSEEYRAARDAALESLAKGNEQDAKKACEQQLAPGS